MNIAELERFERVNGGRVPLKDVPAVLGCSRRTVGNYLNYPPVHPLFLAVVRGQGRPFCSAAHLRQRAAKAI